jgi:putative hydrolase of the HAD superfamily
MIFFDLDDTLLDHESAARAGATQFFKTYQSYFSENLEDFIVRWERVAEKFFQSNNIVDYTLWEQRRLRVRELFSAPITDEVADERFRVYLETYELNWKLYEDAIPCLEAFKGQSLGLITNGEGEQQRLKIRKLGLGPYLSTIIISREVQFSKPQKAIFELAAKQAGVPINECVYVGDRLQVDAIASQQAGMKGIWLDRKSKGNGKEIEVPVIKSLMELPKLLR